MMHEVNLSHHFEPIGELHQAVVYPVKSMDGVDVAKVGVGFYGLDGDRRRVFSKVGGEASRANNAKAHLTNRDRGMQNMMQFTPRFVDPQQMDTSDIEIMTPSGVHYAFEDDGLKSLLEKQSGLQLARRFYKGGFPDNHRVSVIGLPSVRRLGKEIGMPDLDPKRFRANFYIDFRKDFIIEEGFSGLLLKFGIGKQAPIVVIQRLIDRCMMVNIDPSSADVNPAVLKQIAQKYGNFFGVYGEVIRPGIANRGDKVRAVRLSYS